MHHIAVDIGASSGRLVHAQLLDGHIQLKELHRFKNEFHHVNNHFCWDVHYLMDEILKGLAIAKQQGIVSCTLGIDTWAIDYALIAQNGELLQPVIAYRDHRTDHTMSSVFQQMDGPTIYQKTGIQFLPFNTLFQLYEENKDILTQTASILLVPDYINYRLTGHITAEITNASTTQLLNIATREYDEELLQILGLSRAQFPPLIEPGTVIGPLRMDAFPTYDLPACTVIAVASHDTASAALGTPASTDNWAYLSSGTWSLIGIETKQPIVTTRTLEENYTNEYGAAHTYRFLKNVMGLWIIQEVQRLLPTAYTFEVLVEKAKKVPPLQQYINLNDSRFINPDNMIEELQAYCLETKQPIPNTEGELAAAVYYNLAIIIAHHLEQIEEIVGHSIDVLHIVGGGAHNDFLNQCIATFSQKTVVTGPTEATAIGNLLVQLIHVGTVESIEAGRALVRRSFPHKVFTPLPCNQQQLFSAFSHATTFIESEG
ncbi:rhamnulokinase [Lysinibacillus sp. NPDC056232]|uniref:rhamnulokinase n=1 Tax=Lysinibacillus sp. NPDC056232 TaxID=3345756 RepID=UPI0035D71DA5